MVLPIALVVVVAITVWAASGPWPRALLVLAAGVTLWAPLAVLGRLRIPWPNFPLPFAIALNPYLLAFGGMALTLGGALALAVHGVRALGARARMGRA